ncbi:MAG: hypothetical protein QOH23_1738 [Gaiellaceae bacterium]|jgi:hypothetical protein|nr:hypothetical protein [Gaiellaceae bacterium]
MRRTVLVGTYAAALAAGTVLSAQFWMQAFSSRGLQESGPTMLLPGARARSVPALVLGSTPTLQPTQNVFGPGRFSLAGSPLQVPAAGTGSRAGGEQPGPSTGGASPPPTGSGPPAGGGGSPEPVPVPVPEPVPVPTPQAVSNVSYSPPVTQPPTTQKPTPRIHQALGRARGHHKPGKRGATPAVRAQPATPPSSRPATPATPALPPAHAKPSKSKGNKPAKPPKKPSGASDMTQTPADQSSGPPAAAASQSGGDDTANGHGRGNGNGHTK